MNPDVMTGKPRLKWTNAGTARTQQYKHDTKLNLGVTLHIASMPRDGLQVKPTV